MTISIIIPIYNVGELLRKSVESILNQPHDDCEIILVNDGSTDLSPIICQEYSHWPNVKVINKPNGGLSSARNAGVEAASGEYFLFLDADDYLRHGSLDLLRKLTVRYNDFDFIQYRYDEAGDYSDEQAASLDPSNVIILSDRHQMFTKKLELGGIGASACTKLIHRKIFQQLRFREGIIHEDELFTAHLINQAKKAIYISDALYVYVQRQGSIITSEFSPKKLDAITVAEEQIQILLDNKYFDLVQQVRETLFNNLCIMYVRAQSAFDKQSARRIRLHAQNLVKQVTPTNPTTRLIAKGLKLHIPALQIYNLLFSIKHGQTPKRHN